MSIAHGYKKFLKTTCSGVASYGAPHWGTCPPDFQQFHF